MRKKLEHENFRSLKKTIAKYMAKCWEPQKEALLKNALNVSSV